MVCCALPHHLLTDGGLLGGVGFFGERLDDLALLDARSTCHQDTVACLQSAGDGVVLPIIDGADGDFGEGELTRLVDSVDELLMQHLDGGCLGNKDRPTCLCGQKDRPRGTAAQTTCSIGEVDTQSHGAGSLVNDTADALDRPFLGVLAPIGEA